MCSAVLAYKNFFTGFLGLNSGADFVSVMGLSSAVGKIVYGFVGSKLRSKILIIFTISQVKLFYSQVIF